MGNVASLVPRLKKNPTDSDVVSEILHINSGKSPVRLGHKYHVRRADNGVSILYVEYGDRCLREVNSEMLFNDVSNYVFNIRKPRAPRSDTKIRSIVKVVISLIEPLAKPPATLGFPSMNNFVFHRIPFEADFDEDKCPLFLEIMSRTTNADALMAFIGSIFIPHSDKSQWCWLYGEGQNGKGTLLRVLQYVLNGCYASEDVPAKTDKFWTSGLVGKRLVAFADCDNPNFPATGFFRKLTGGDHVRIEGKGKHPYTTTLDAKFMFMSNARPIIDGNRADRRRAIYCEVGPVATKNLVKNYEKKIIDEAPYIIGHCMYKYAELVTGHENTTIPVDDESFDQISGMNNDLLDAVFHSIFIHDPQPDKLARDQPKVAPWRMQELLEKCGMLKTLALKASFLAHICNKYSVKKQMFKDHENRVVRAYLGIRERFPGVGDITKNTDIVDRLDLS